MKRSLALLSGIGLILATAIVPAHGESTSQDVAYGTGSVLTTLVYAPMKASFCILGGIRSGFTLPFAGPQTAGQVASTACGGTWAITPAALKGKERVRFVGDQSSQQRSAKR